jgi:signal transduction histidine kinase
VSLSKEKKRVKMLVTLIGLALLSGVCVMGLEWVENRSGLAFLGAVVSAMSLALLVLLERTFERWSAAKDAEWEDCRQKMEAAHKRGMRELRDRARSDMDNFRGAMSHTLRMPVAIIQGYAELLAGGMVEDPKVCQEYLEKIIQRSRYLSHAMSQQFSLETEMDVRKLSYEDMDLLRLVKHVAADMRAVAQERSVVIHVLSSEQSVPIKADAYLLNWIIFNLLENSLKYMGRPGTITVRVGIEEEWITIAVRDDGMGLSAEETEHVFECSFRGCNHSVSGGQGYGLYLVKQAVEAHGGQVSAQSEVGYGMNISIKLPSSPPETEGDA